MNERGLPYIATLCKKVSAFCLLLNIINHGKSQRTEEIHLRFWQWFSHAGLGRGYVQISVYDDTQEWSDWKTISDPIESSTSVWSKMDVDLTSYAGKKVRIAFYHTAHTSTGTGWYIDDKWYWSALIK